MVLSWGRNEVYRGKVGIWEDAVLKAPDNPRVHTNLGALLQNQGESERAFRHSKKGG